MQAVRFFNLLPKSLKISESSLQVSPPYVYQFQYVHFLFCYILLLWESLSFLSSLQYHHAIILLHRPFLKSLYRGQTSSDYDPHGRDVHSRACKKAAEKMCSILRIYRKNFTNVRWLCCWLCMRYCY